MSTTRLPVAGSTTEPERAASPPRTVLFGWGFRPFFLAAGIYAFAPLLVWLFEFSTGTDLTARWSAMFFHGHEMVFGFAAAAVTGFLLTAVPNWTGTDRVHGPKLAALAALWLAGRVAMWCSAWLPAWLVTVVDLALFPTLALTLAGPLIRAKRARNMPFPVLLLVLFAGGSYFKWFPLRGLTSDNWAQLSWPERILDYFWHLALPITAMALGAFATTTLLTKNSFLDEIRKQYVLTARMKGLNERQVLYGHVFRNAMLIIIAGFPGAFIGAFFAGSLLIETIFTLDGLGLLGFESIVNRDYPVVFATLYIFSLMGLLVNLISDLTYTWVDPRIDFESRDV